jgi:uncharacterized protein YciI
MTYYAVYREAGPGWSEGLGALEQPGVYDHSAFMNQLAEQGFVLFAGPLAGSEAARIRVLLIASADGEAEIHRRLADDPWVHTQRLETTAVETCNLFVGADRLGRLLTDA